MRLVGLISGGKDSTYAMMQCIATGHEIVALANLMPTPSIDELDSYMYQTVGHQGISSYASAMGLPLYRREILGDAVNKGKYYSNTAGDEVEDLYQLLLTVKGAEHIEGVTVGAILSDYQRVRVEDVCGRLGLTCYSYLWRRDQKELLSEMLSVQIKAITVKVAALGLEPSKHLGKELSELQPHLLSIEEKYGINVCGEGGEYETYTLDCPLFKEKIVIDESEVVSHLNDPSVAYLNIKRLHLEPKQHTSVEGLKIRMPTDFLGDLDFVSSPDELSSIAVENLEEFYTENPGLVSYVNNRAVTSVCCYKDNDDVMGSTRKVFDQLKNLINMNTAAAIYLFVDDMKNYAEINNVYKTYFELNPPARVCVEVPLPKNVLFLLECVSHRDEPEKPRHTMHVQSVSHWAPANIGPYSQAVDVGGRLYIAGQIGLIPGSMQLVEGWSNQAKLSLRHLERAINAMGSQWSLSDMLYGVCYLTPNASYEGVMRIWSGLSLGEAGDRMTFLMVNGLPRGALVEWQVTLQKNGDDAVFFYSAPQSNSPIDEIRDYLNKPGGSGAYRQIVFYYEVNAVTTEDIRKVFAESSCSETSLTCVPVLKIHLGTELCRFLLIMV